MVFESAATVCVPPLAVHVTLSSTTMSDKDFHRLHRKYYTTNVENAGKPEDCGQSNPAKSNLEGQKSPKSSPGMQSKGSQKEKFFGKGWRNRSKVIANAGNSLWAPDSKENFVWSSVGGRKVCLGSFDICDLTEPERIALQQVALSKLRKLNLRSHVTIPKSSRSDKRTSSLKRALSLKSRLSMGASDKVTESAVFAVPLRKAVVQSTPDNIDNKVKKGSQEESIDGKSEGEEEPRERRHSASSLHQPFPKATLGSSTPSKGSLNGSREPPGSPTWKSRLIDALTLNSSSASASCIIDRDAMLIPQPPRVPPIVTQAIEHLENYGLHVLGIFRTGGSKRRMKQMREQFDSGEKAQFSADDNPHDVAALFKEYFRDLPEPLMTRELYAAFLETQGIDDENQRKATLQLLCCLLPPPNRDTLKALLEFLSKVDFYSEDKLDENAIEIPGNKMNSRNLATLIGPNILHKVKAGHTHDYAVDDPTRAGELRETIDTVQELIQNWQDLFIIKADLYHEIYQHLLESEPEILDYLLRKKTPIRISAGEDEVPDVTSVSIAKAEPYRVRCRSAGDSDRPPVIIRAGNALNTRPPPDYHQHKHRNHGYTIKSTRHVAPTRSQSLNREEGNTLRKYARQTSNPDPTPRLSVSFNGVIRTRQKTPPLHPRGAHRVGTSEPPSPSLSSSLSHSTYSTPPSSPPLTPYFSAESTCSSPVSVSYLGSEGPVVTELEELLYEVEKDLQKERVNNAIHDLDLETDIPDWQLERWIRWETLAHSRNNNREALEQETLV